MFFRTKHYRVQYSKHNLQSTMKKIFTILVCCYLFVVGNLFAQVAVIGTGTDVPAATLYAPVYRFSAGSTTTAARSNILYTAAELSAAGITPGSIISSVEFYKANDANFITPANFKMYMGNTSNTTLPTTTTWASIMAAQTEVYNNAAFNMPNSIGWVTWTITPFTYTGGSLEIATDMTMAGANGATSFVQWQYTASTPTDLVIGATGTTGPATLNGTVAQYKNRPNIRINFSSAPCTAPPTPGTTVSSATSTLCNGQAVQLSLSGNSSGSGQTYTWQSSTTAAGTYTSIGTASQSNSLNINPSSSLYYRAAVTCGASTTYSTPVLVSVASLIPASTFSINSNLATGGTNFQTFADAINYIKCGISGPIVFNVDATSGPYSEQVIIPQIFGTSATNTITFNGNGRALTFNSTNTNERAGVKFNGADWVTVNNLVITGTGSASTEYNFGVQLLNDADNNTISNCVINLTAASTSTNYTGISISGSAISATTTGSLCDSNTVINNTINGGYYGITLVGDAAAFVTGNKILNNQVNEWYLYGIYVAGNTNALIERNDISRQTRSTVSTFTGIYFTGNSQACSVSKNRLHDPFKGVLNSTSAAYGIYFTSCDAAAGQENLVSNNLLYNFNGGGIQYGLYSVGSDSIRYYHNTVSLEDAAYTGTSVTYGFYQTTTAKGIDIKNNIIQIKRGGAGSKYCLYFGATGTVSTIVSNSNDLLNLSGLGTNGTGYTALPTAGGFTSLDNWKSNTTYDANSFAIDPTFQNPAADNFLPTASLLDNRGIAVGVTTDIVGVSRSSTSPDIGAYEFTTSTTGINVGAEAMVAPAVSAAGCYSDREPVTIRIRNSSTNIHNFVTNPVTVRVTVGGAANTLLSTIISAGTLAAGATLEVSMDQNLNMTAIGTYSFSATTLLVGDANPANDAMPEVSRTRIVLSGGTGAATPPSYCITGGTPTLSTTGTSGAANIQWQRSAVSGTGFTNIPGATTSPYTLATPITGTIYYRLVATCNSISTNSTEAVVALVNPLIVSTIPGSRCGPGTVNLSATASAGAGVSWYDLPVGGTPLATTPSFVTPSITNTTTFYAAAGSTSTVATGMPVVSSNPTSGAGTTAFGLVFDVTSTFTLLSVTIYPVSSTGASGTVTIDITNSAGAVLNTTTVNVTGSPTASPVPLVVPLNFDIQPGTNYKIRPGFTGISGLLFEPSAGAPGGNYGYPYVVPGVLSINYSTLTAAPTNTPRPDLYYYFYNWQIRSGCQSSRVPVTATIDNSPECGVVPVTFLSFKGEKAGAINKLEWRTATEANNTGFELQRSADGINFSKLAFIPTKAINGNSTSLLVYSFDDVRPLLSNGYYRLKQIDKDGKSAYSAVVLLKVSKPAELTISSIYPNPVHSQLNMIVSAPVQERLTLIITDLTGRIVKQKIMDVISGDNTVGINVQQLTAGSYTIKAVCANGCTTAVQKFVKQ